MLHMRRRDFIQLSVFAAGAGLVRAYGLDKQATAAPLWLTIRPDRTISTIEPDFTGLSYETQQLGDPTFFSPYNHELVALVRRLGKSGVLRIGGNTSEYAYWTPNPTAADLAQEGAAIGPSTGHGPDAKRHITPEAIDNLRGFLDATGWKLIYGLNLGTGTAEAAGAEAAYVMNAIGPKLMSFQIGNEPDDFQYNGVRKRGYGYADFAGQWRQFYEVIHSRVPNAPFSGPDTGGNNEWLESFAREFRHEVIFLSQHYYAEGPPSNPSMTIERLLKPSPRLKAEFAAVAETRRETGLPFRLTETNSCYGGGKQGVSNAYASSLWGAELMYQLAAAGGDGINFHGGGYGWYTPIAGTQVRGFEARPIYYGMLLFAEAGAGRLVESHLDRPQPEDVVAAYSVRTDSGLKTVLFNKNPDSTQRVTIDPGLRTGHATVLALTGPSLDATCGVKLGDARVSSFGQWENPHRETIQADRGRIIVDLPAASAALISFEA